MQGAAGVQGSTGAQGAKGDQGATGAKGDQGNQGTQGLRGYQGYQGTPGVQGDTGAQGAKGDQGYQGYQGAKGDQGATGTQGTQGYQGYQGTQGVPTSLAADADVLLGLSGSQMTLDSQAANLVFAGPQSGASADPTFRALVTADIPGTSNVIGATEISVLKCDPEGSLRVDGLAVGSTAILAEGYAYIQNILQVTDSGSASYPALRVGGDINTGIWQSAADNIDISTGGTNRLNISSTGAAVTGSIISSAFTRLGPGSTLTVSSGGITVTGSRHYVDTESGLGTDDLYVINGGATGDILVLSSVSYTKVTTLKDSASGSNNLRLAGDFALGDTSDMIMLMRIGDNWHEISRSNN